MPDFNTFIRNRPELHGLPEDEQQSEYESYIAEVLDTIAD